MHHFNYVGGVLHVEDMPVPEMAEQVGTPFYCYSTATLTRHFTVFSGAFDGMDTVVCYSVKANSNIAVLRTLASLGSGADIVSGGELARAMKAGIPASKIVFSGVGKTEDEMRAALAAGVLQFNVESEPELELLNQVAVDMRLEAAVALRINPDVDAKTHEKIATGKSENKFGLPWTQARDIYARAAALPGIRIEGVDVHIGSQLTDLQPLEDAFVRVAELVSLLREDGHNITRVDLGGGLGIPYHPEDPEPPHPDAYADVVRRTVGDLGCQIVFEPGRMIAGNAGIMVTRVVYVKETGERTFAILDGAMNDLARPSLYGSYHHIQPVKEDAGDDMQLVDFVGPVCETGDTFATSRESGPLQAGDLVAIMSAGAYGAVMASSYNTRPLTPEVLVKDDQFAVVRRRPDYEEILAQESIPNWVD